MSESGDPVAMHLGVGVEQDRIARGMQRHGAVDRAHEALIACIAQQGDLTLGCQVVQKGSDGWLRRGIIHHHEFAVAS